MQTIITMETYCSYPSLTFLWIVILHFVFPFSKNEAELMDGYISCLKWTLWTYV